MGWKTPTNPVVQAWHWLYADAPREAIETPCQASLAALDLLLLGLLFLTPLCQVNELLAQALLGLHARPLGHLAHQTAALAERVFYPLLPVIFSVDHIHPTLDNQAQ